MFYSRFIFCSTVVVDCTDARPSTYRPHGLGQQRKYHERLVRALLASAHRVGGRVKSYCQQALAAQHFFFFTCYICGHEFANWFESADSVDQSANSAKSADS